MFFSLDFGKLKLVLSISSYGISTVNSFIFFTRPFKADIFFFISTVSTRSHLSMNYDNITNC